MPKRLEYRESHDCRICGGPVETVLELGNQPLANSFLKSPDEEDPVYPLDLKLCRACIHLQLGVVVDRLGIFQDYIYTSRPNPKLSTHFEAYAKDVMRRVSLEDGIPLIVELGSNDGLLLEYFVNSGYRVTGVDPADNVQSPVRTVRKLWSREVAKTIRDEVGNAEAILANNVLAHIDDLNDAVSGMATLLAQDGIVVIELPYANDLWTKGIYDTIYHEHLSVMGLTALCTLFERHGLYLFHHEYWDVQGESVRCFFGKQQTVYHEQHKMMERTLKHDDPRRWVQVRKRVEDQKMRLRHRLQSLKDAGKSIVGYGAPAKGNTMLNYTGAGEYLECLIDDMPSKQGLYAPGSHLRVMKREDVNPDAFLLLAWNYRMAIMQREASFTGEFIHPYFA